MNRLGPGASLQWPPDIDNAIRKGTFYVVGNRLFTTATGKRVHRYHGYVAARDFQDEPAGVQASDPLSSTPAPSLSNALASTSGPLPGQGQTSKEA